MSARLRTALSLLAVAASACNPVLGPMRTSGRYALGFEGAIESYGACVLAEPSGVFVEVPGKPSVYRASATGTARFRCGSTDPIEHTATVEVPVRLEVSVSTRLAVRERSYYRVEARDAHGQPLRVSDASVTSSGAVGRAVSHGCMDFGSVGDVVEGIEPGIGHVRVTAHGLAAEVQVEVVPAATASAAPPPNSSANDAR